MDSLVLVPGEAKHLRRPGLKIRHPGSARSHAIHHVSRVQAWRIELELSLTSAQRATPTPTPSVSLERGDPCRMPKEPCVVPQVLRGPDSRGDHPPARAEPVLFPFRQAAAEGKAQATIAVCLTHKGPGHIGIDDLGYQSSQRGLQVPCFLAWPRTFVTSTLFLFGCSPISMYVPVLFYSSSAVRPSAICAVTVPSLPRSLQIEAKHHHQSLWASANRIRTKSICATTP